MSKDLKKYNKPKDPKQNTGGSSNMSQLPKKNTKDNSNVSQPPKKNTKALSISDPVARYLEEVKKFPLLSKERERELAIQYYETKDPEAAQALVTANLRFVVKVAAEYALFGSKLIDLIQEGNVGLMHAVKEFNPYKDVRLITYAVWWIRGHIQDYLMRQYSIVRIGTNQKQKKLFYQLQKRQRELQNLGYDMSVKQLSSQLDVPEEDVSNMTQRMSHRDVSLNQPVNPSDPSTTLIDLQESPDGHFLDEEFGKHQELSHLKNNIEKIRPLLSTKELFLLEKRLLADPPMTLQDIGKKYRVTREAIRQMEARLIKKIKNAYNN